MEAAGFLFELLLFSESDSAVLCLSCKAEGDRRDSSGGAGGAGATRVGVSTARQRSQEQSVSVKWSPPPRDKKVPGSMENCTISAPGTWYQRPVDSGNPPST